MKPHQLPPTWVPTYKVLPTLGAHVPRTASRILMAGSRNHLQGRRLVF